jgi:hypothetical protein
MRGVSLKRALTGALVATTTAVALATAIAPAHAQESGQTIDEAFEDAYYTRDGNFYQNQSFPRSFTWITGPFTENEIASDGRRIKRTYRDALLLQNNSDPTMRTPDLPNPFAYSLMNDSLYQEEGVPLSPPSSFLRSTPPGVPTPGMTSPMPSGNGGSVRGLW